MRLCKPNQIATKRNRERQRLFQRKVTKLPGFPELSNKGIIDSDQQLLMFKREVAKYIAYKLEQEQPCPIDVADVNVLKNFWLQFCFQVRFECCSGGNYLESFIKEIIRNVFIDMSLDDEEYEQLWLSTERGEIWKGPREDCDEVVPWELDDIIEVIFWEVYNIAVECDDPDFLDYLDKLNE